MSYLTGGSSTVTNDVGYDHLFKLLLIGDASVGKSSILLRFSDDEFDSLQQPTIGVDFKVAYHTIDDKRIKSTIWDTAGQERFRTLTSSYYRGAHGVVLVYDVTQPETFHHLQHWLDEVKMYCKDNGKNVTKLLVGNKVDLTANREVSKSEGQAWARNHGMLFIETSAKTKLGIQSVFEELIRKIMENPDILARTAPHTARTEDSLNLGNDTSSGSTGCC